MSQCIQKLKDEIKSLEQLQESNSLLLSRSDNTKAIYQIKLLRDKIGLILEADNQESNVVIKKRKRSSNQSKQMIYANGKFNKLANELNFLLLKSINDKKGECEILSDKIATMKIEILSRENPVLYKDLVAKEKNVVELEKKNELWKSEMKDAEWRIDNYSKNLDTLKKKYYEIRKNGELIQEEISEYSPILGVNRKALNNLKAKLRNMKKSNHDVLDQIEQHNNTISALEESIENFKNGKVNARIVELRKERSNFKIIYDKLTRLRVNYDFKLRTEKENIEQFKNLIKSAEKEKENLVKKHGKISSINNDIQSYNTESKRLDIRLSALIESKVDILEIIKNKKLDIQVQRDENTKMYKLDRTITDFIENGTDLVKTIENLENLIEQENTDLEIKLIEIKKKRLNQKEKFKEASKIQEEMLICPISQDLIEDPVLCEDGYIYERSAILNWWKRSKTSPITKQRLSAKPGINIQDDCIKVFYKSMVDAFKLQEKKKVNAASSKFVDSIIKGNPSKEVEVINLT